jgi:ATP-dependent DNA ligase
MTIHRFPSSSAPGVVYETRVAADGTSASCNCPGWTKRVGPDGGRECKHTKQVLLQARQQKVLATPTPVPRASADRRFESRSTDLTGSGYVQPMLASPMPEGCSLRTYEGDTGWWLEEKYDGHRVVVAVADGRVAAWSRPRSGTVGLPRQLPLHIQSVMAAFPEGTYDGELIAPGGHAWSVTDARFATKLRLVLFDVLQLDGSDLTRQTAAVRRRRLEALGDVLFKKRVAAVFVAPAYPVSRAQVQKIWDAGGEGAVLKRRLAVYQPGARSRDWIKVKLVESLVGTITGFVAGKNGPYATVALRLPNGGETTVKTKDAATMRAFAADPQAFIGRRLRIECQGVFNGQPRHPMFDHLVDPPARRRARCGP